MVELQVHSDIFPGFYNTYLDFDEVEECDYENYKNNVCNRVIDIIKEYYPVDSWRLFSPKAYDYRNDKIYVTINLSLGEFLTEYIKDTEGQYEYVMDWDFSQYRDKYIPEAFMESMMYTKIFENMEFDFNLEEYLKHG